jgi:hypothetical protein
VQMAAQHGGFGVVVVLRDFGEIDVHVVLLLYRSASEKDALPENDGHTYIAKIQRLSWPGRTHSEAALVKNL